MPKKQNPLTPEQQHKLFKDEVRKRKKAGDFDMEAAEKALEGLVKRARFDGR